MTDHKSVLVVGGGIVGLTTAYALCSRGLEVTVLDEGPKDRRASTATAGIIGGSSVIPWASAQLWPRLPIHLLVRSGPLHIGFPLPEGAIIFFCQSVRAGRDDARAVSAAGLANLGLRGWDAWQELLKDLPQAREMFVQHGCLFFYGTPAQQQSDADSNAQRRGFGMTLTDLDRAEMQALLPPLTRPVAGGTRVELAGHVSDPAGLQNCLKSAIVEQGGKFIAQRVTGFEKTGNRVNSVTAGGTQNTADAIVIAAGSGAGALAAEFGHPVPMVPAWGASVTFTNPPIDLELPFLVLSDGVAITPSAHGLRVSGLLQIGGAGKTEALKTKLIAIAKGLFGDFSYSEIQSCAGPRPLTADSLPFLGPDPQFGNLFYNFGHGHWGLTQASISAQITCDLVLGRTPSVDISAYKPDRY